MAFEFDILDHIQTLRTPFLDKLMMFFSFLGDKGLIWIVLTIALIIYPRTRKCGITLLISLTFCLIFGEIALKLIVNRQRPCAVSPPVDMLIAIPHDSSFPSAHTFSSFISATVIFFHRKAFGVLCFVLSSFIAVSRMYLYVHFPTDIATGLVFGVVFGIIITRLMNRYFERKDELRSRDV